MVASASTAERDSLMSTGPGGTVPHIERNVRALYKQSGRMLCHLRGAARKWQRLRFLGSGLSIFIFRRRCHNPSPSPIFLTLL